MLPPFSFGGFAFIAHSPQLTRYTLSFSRRPASGSGTFFPIFKKGMRPFFIQLSTVRGATWADNVELR